jgi:RNA polymerase sigma factor for flagellar operon FliA
MSSPIDDPKNKSKIDGFLIEHAPLINFAVKQLKNEGKIHPDIDESDLHYAGFHGLMDAVHKYDPNMGANFATYAKTRIRGKMLDHLASQDYIPKQVRTQAKNVAALGPKPPKIKE